VREVKDVFHQRADVLIEALPYIRRFRGKTFVIKYGGHAMQTEELRESFAQEVVLLDLVGINPVIVHGGGPQITELIGKLGLKSRFVRGMRVTDPATMEAAEMVLQRINKNLVATISRMGGRAVGLSGKDGDLIRSRKMRMVVTDDNGKRSSVDIGLVGDVQATLQALTPQLTPKQNRNHLDQCLEHYQKARKGLDDLATGVPGKKAIHPQYVAKVVDQLAAEDTVFTCDVGTPTIWAARYLTMNGKRRLLGSFSHGSMANALPQAIGAQAAFPGRQVITFSGDGGLAMLMGDLLSLKQLNLPVKLVVFNNSSLAFVELEMKAAGILDYATELQNPNFADIARAAGLFGVRVEDPGELQESVKRALEYDGPALIDVVTAREELAMPPTIELKQAVGFSLYMAKAVLSGRGDEIIDLAKTNLFR